MGQLHRCARKSKGHAEKDGGAARGAVSLGSDEGDQRAQQQPCEKATDMRSIVSDAVRSEEVGQKSQARLKATNINRLRSVPESAERGTENSPSLKAAMRAPASPKMAPDAPTLRT